jgi:16S rRNA (cytidine1402-2'-O)-methyltransferase
VVFYEAPHRIARTLEELGARFGRLPVCVAREVSKVHESVIIGRLTEIAVDQQMGEFAVVVEFGDLTKLNTEAVVVDAGVIAHEFGVMTKTDGLRRRQAIASLSRKYRLSAREVYAMVEAAKNAAV